MGDENLDRILESLNYLKEHCAKKEDIQKLVTTEHFDYFKAEVLEKIDGLRKQ